MYRVYLFYLINITKCQNGVGTAPTFSFSERKFSAKIKGEKINNIVNRQEIDILKNWSK
jgi:hypothetical protein